MWPQNAFSNRLQFLGLNFFALLVVDLMHEFELGVWKRLFIHLLRMLASVNPSLLYELDHRHVILLQTASGTNYCIVLVIDRCRRLVEIRFDDSGPMFLS
jgi:hypothetical protein